MPPLPLDFSNLTVSKSTRMGLDFEQSPPSARLRNTFKSRDLNIQHNETYEAACNMISRQAKRSLECTDMTPLSKRRCQIFTCTPKSELETAMPTESPLSKIIDAVEKLSTESSIVADGSRDNVVPTISGKHSDLNAISPETMCDVINGVYEKKMANLTIIDCRYPYEYNGGHIKGAVNLYTKEAIQQFLKESVTSSHTNHVLIFHCEFSSERGPKMYRFLRSLDRDMNKEHYPRLHFPEIYLLEGGYKAFFYTCKEKCVPQSYKIMLHKEHKEELRYFRVKSKSWSEGDRRRRSRDTGSGMRLRF